MTGIFQKLNFKSQPTIYVENPPESFHPAASDMRRVTAVHESLTGRAYPGGTSENYQCEFNSNAGWGKLGELGFEPVRQVAIDVDRTALRFRRVEHDQEDRKNRIRPGKGYNQGVRTLAAAALTIVVGLSGQVSNEAQIRNDLTSSLMSLQGSSRDAKQEADALTTQLLALPEAPHQPKRSTLSAFAQELAASVAGRGLRRAAAAQMATDIAGALRSAGIAASTFKRHISHFETTLADIGVNAFAKRALVSRLREAGEQARGPQDLPLIQD